ncbi:MAG: hypothetical protein CML42_00230 [Rhodobacteraceae bacterium]|nr:hypothetical protein [Paracoccaceae bacterium]|tara:strand:- start:3719 stop:4624 length:906 start_codon:yes stop_codon:yes gene_type:complete
MATALINGQESIISQIHTSWNEFRSTDEAMVLMFGEVGSNYRDYHEIPLAKDFAKSDTPWTTKETVLEKNAVHANNLIRYYIGLNIDVAERMHIWQFFEIGTGIVGKIKEQIKLLKRIQKVLKLEQELEIHEPLPNATSLFTYTAHLSLENIEDFLKLKVKEAKAAKKLALKVAKQAAKQAAKVLATKKKIIAAIVKKNDSRTDGSMYMGNINTTLSVEDLREVLKTLPLVIKANKAQAKKAAKEAKAKAKEAKAKAKKAAKNLATKHANFAKKVLSLLKFAQANNYTVEDIVLELKAQVE